MHCIGSSAGEDFEFGEFVHFELFHESQRRARVAIAIPLVEGDGGVQPQRGRPLPPRHAHRTPIRIAGLRRIPRSENVAADPEHRRGVEADPVPARVFERAFQLSTLDLGGQVKFGPDIEWVDGLDYDVDPARAALFARAIRRYWPDLSDGALQPGYSGIRPKIAPKGAPPHDFVIQGPRDHGVAGLVNLYGIESPGLTASPAIAEMVAGLLERE